MSSLPDLLGERLRAGLLLRDLPLSSTFLRGERDTDRKGARLLGGERDLEGDRVLCLVALPLMPAIVLGGLTLLVRGGDLDLDNDLEGERPRESVE